MTFPSSRPLPSALPSWRGPLPGTTSVPTPPHGTDRQAGRHTGDTLADMAIEQRLRDEIAAVYPAHGILGEEHDSVNLGAEWVWVIDPIDGTKAFTCGKPQFGTLIALTHRGVPVVG